MLNMLRKISVFLVLLSALFLVACTNQTEETTASNSEASEIKVGVVFTVAGLGGESFNDLVFDGVKQAEKDFGITYDYVEPKSVSDQEITLDEMASSEMYQLIIAVGFEQVDAIKVVAENYPDQKFALIDAIVDLPNVACYVSSEEEGSFLLGSLAALVKNNGSVDKISQDKILGFIGGVESPLINKFAAGYTAGARYVDKDFSVLIDYVGGFNDPSTAKVIAETMYEKDADLIFHAAGASGMGLFQAAEEKGFVALGVNSNQNKIAPDYIMASMLKLANQATYDVIESIVNDQYNPGVNTLGLSQEGVGITLEKSNIQVPEEIVKQVEEIKNQIIEGQIKVPTELDKVEEFVKNNQLQ
ncbi:TPA: BMP family protein [Streptococcus suis]